MSTVFSCELSQEAILRSRGKSWWRWFGLDIDDPCPVCSRRGVNRLIGEHRAENPSRGDGDLPDINKAIDATALLFIERAKGNAIAIAPKLALASLHGYGKVGTTVKLITTKGGLTLSGKIVFNEFTRDLVDIAVVELTGGGDTFPEFLDVNFDGVKLAQRIHVVGIRTGAAGETMSVIHPCYINAIEGQTGSAMFQSDFSSFDGLSGAGVVTRVVNGITKIVAVHVASHDDSKKPPKVKRQQDESVEAKSVDLAVASLASEIHGHYSYCLCCEIARVPALINFLRTRGLK